MAHPFASHRQHSVERSRVARMAKGYATGGAVHPDEKEDKALVRQMVKRKALKAEGEPSKHRADRPGRKKGGRVNKGKVTVNVITGGPPPAAGVAMAPPMPPPVAAVPPGPPPGPPPGAMMPPGGPPPDMPMPPRAHGGRAYKKGGAVGVNKGTKVFEEGRRSGTQVSHDPGKNDLKDMNRPKPITYKTGGKVEAPQTRHSDSEINAPQRRTANRMNAPQGVEAASKLPGGAGGGEGRLAKARRASR